MKSQNDWDIFVHNITWLRKHYGIFQKRMAVLLGIGIASLKAIENGQIPPRLSVEIFFHIHPVVQLPQRLGESDES